MAGRRSQGDIFFLGFSAGVMTLFLAAALVWTFPTHHSISLIDVGLVLLAVGAAILFATPWAANRHRHGEWVLPDLTGFRRQALRTVLLVMTGASFLAILPPLQGGPIDSVLAVAAAWPGVLVGLWWFRGWMAKTGEENWWRRWFPVRAADLRNALQASAASQGFAFQARQRSQPNRPEWYGLLQGDAELARIWPTGRGDSAVFVRDGPLAEGVKQAVEASASMARTTP